MVERAEQVLGIDASNEDARSLIVIARRGLGEEAPVVAPAPGDAAESQPALPSSFASGRYQVRELLGEGGKKRVFRAHDTLLDRDVAFALVRSEGLDATGRERIAREAQAMARLGAHAHVVSVFDIGEEQGQPYIVAELMAGGDVEGLLREAGGPLAVERTLEIATGVCRALEFAHANSVVHRDLKPGNVFLTEDGTAKLGDLGIAVALDRTRVTLAGGETPVGTVNYMPPEQAVEGEITPPTDLYSLGAMLYELVTGRPPFVSEDPWAVISQHLETPPVAPSWHTEHCPPALEELILRLLAKAPDDRPESASDVLRVLERIDPTQGSARPADANPLERLARGVFVGREQELERLRAAFDGAVSGSGGVVMVVGEPGIGKTRTVQELETYARMRSGRVLWGRAHEAAGAPAYWPWVQALRGYVASADPEALRDQLGSGAPEVARVVSEVRERLPDLPEPAEITDPECLRSSGSSTPSAPSCAASLHRRRWCWCSTICTGRTSRR